MNLLSLPITTDSAYEPVNQKNRQNDRDEEKGASPPVLATGVTREILLENIQELKREFQETTQDFSNRLEQLVSQVEDLKCTNQDNKKSCQQQQREHPEHQVGNLNDNQAGVGVILQSEDRSKRSQENDQSKCYYREPGTAVYISFASRLLVSFLSLITFNEGTLSYVIGYAVTFDVLGGTFMVMSVLTLFGSTYKKKDWVYLIGWLVNMIGAIGIFIVMAVQADLPSYVMILLASGHAVELLRLLYETRFRKHRWYIFSLAAFVAAAIYGGFFFNHYYPHSIIIFSVCLIVHSISQYIALFHDTPNLGNNDEEQEGENGDKTVLEKKKPLDDNMKDSYMLMVVSNDPKAWNLGFMVFLMQVVLSVMILLDQLSNNQENSIHLPFNGSPFKSFSVTTAQFVSILLSIFWQTDIQTSIQMFGMLRYRKNEGWPHQEIDAKDGTPWTWLDKIFLPNSLRFVAGLLALTNSFFIILQSDNVIDLFKDFTALILISEIDNLAFSLANQNNFGYELKDKADKINKVELVIDDKKKQKIRRIAFLAIFAGMVGCWSYYVHRQLYSVHEHVEGIRKRYPKCKALNETDYLSFYLSSLFGDGRCDHYGEYNKPECGYEGGDCFDNYFPKCKVENTDFIGDGTCSPGTEYDTKECGYDGGDCFYKHYPNCKVAGSSHWIGNNRCDDFYEKHNTPECRFDGGDCFYENFPNCKVEYTDLIGDGNCLLYTEYDTKECGYDGGDCLFKRYPNCTVEKPHWIGNNGCDSGEYNTPECGFEDGDCDDFNANYPNCKVGKPYWIGNGYCDSREYNTPECGYDGGDCL